MVISDFAKSFEGAFEVSLHDGSVSVGLAVRLVSGQDCLLYQSEKVAE